ncbi:MAG: hypothetical protein Q4D98_03530 [Planctomycetia bacterium]|nr:hypothetical protein [Planctomycetia bacterium]
MTGFFESVRRWMNSALSHASVRPPWHFEILIDSDGRMTQSDGGIAFRDVSEGGMVFENVEAC